MKKFLITLSTFVAALVTGLGVCLACWDNLVTETQQVTNTVQRLPTYHDHLGSVMIAVGIACAVGVITFIICLATDVE